jgi:hypothetical protein
VSNPLLHVDLVLLREDLESEVKQALFEEAGALAGLDGVRQIAVIEGEAGSDFDLAFVFTLESLAQLEAFGTDERYIRFLQGGLARAMRSFGGADVQLIAQSRPPGAFAACVALAATPQTYDWQVRDALQAWAPMSVIGLAVGERQRYRGVGVMFSDRPIQRPTRGFQGFGVDFITGPLRLLP